MRIKNVDPKGWYDIPGYDGIYQINYWADIRKKLGNGKYKHLKPYVKKNNQGKRLIKLKKERGSSHEPDADHVHRRSSERICNISQEWN